MHTPTVTLTCPHCGYQGRAAVPIPVELLWCSHCDGPIATPPDFYAPAQSEDALEAAWELQNEIVAAIRQPRSDGHR